MKQIGARQEAGRIGGTGPCGRELCCATWMKNFVSVNTNSARFQDISLNPQKLAGMCAKLKCCLNYEVDNYVEAGRRLPSKEVVLQTQDSDYYLFKSDILAGMVTYSTDKGMAANLEVISAERAKAVIEMNRRGEKPLSLQEHGGNKDSGRPVDLLANENISRFDKARKKKKSGRRPPRQDGQEETRRPRKPAAGRQNAPEAAAENSQRPQHGRGGRRQGNRPPRNNQHRDAREQNNKGQGN